MNVLVVILLVLLLCGGLSFPAYGYNRNWGYAPFSGVVGLLVLLLILRLLNLL